MQKILIAGAALLGLTSAALTSSSSGRIEYDYDCKADYLEGCLQNGITLTGPHVVLINLDNRCQVEKYEREGVFLHTGDLLFVTGREYTCAW